MASIDALRNSLNAAEAGLALCMDEILDDQQYGIVTPSVGLGAGFLKRLERAGVNISFD